MTAADPDTLRYLGWYAPAPPPDPVALARRRVPRRPGQVGGNPADPAGKLAQLAAEVAGQTELALYHAGLVMRIRREIDLATDTARYHDLWRDHAALLLEHLDARWLVSACDTFAEHAGTPAARTAALAVSMFATSVRLYETERRQKGPDLRPMMPPRGRVALFDGLIAVGIAKGDTIANALKRLGGLVQTEDLSARILDRLMSRMAQADTIFPRMAAVHRDDRTAWAPRPAPRATVALFNDTSVSRHCGCEAVMDSIDHLFTGAGLSILWRHPVGRPWAEDAGARAAIASADAVVVNGEGTIHHDRPAARRLSLLARAAAEAGRPAYLINATLQDNGPALLEELRLFRHIWVREGASAAWARDRGLAVTVCPDLSLCQTGLEGDRRSPGTAAVIDSVEPEATLALARHAATLGTRVWSMKRDAEGRPMAAVPAAVLRDATGRDLPFVGFGPPRDFVGYARLLGTRERMVTGRFHAACMALVMRLPFHALPSNTWKTEAMLADAGLDGARMIGPSDPLPGPLPFSAAETAAIDRYLRRARFEAGEMAARILARD